MARYELPRENLGDKLTAHRLDGQRRGRECAKAVIAHSQVIAGSGTGRAINPEQCE
jgi:hypothetical protein